jgi:fucose permease
LNGGVLIGAQVAAALLARRGADILLVIGAAAGAAAVLFLGAVLPPTTVWLRLAGLVVLGTACGVTNTAVFHSITGAFEHDRAATVNLAGIFLGLGCLLTTLLIATTFYIYTASSVMVLVAVIPGLFAIWFGRHRVKLRPLVLPASGAEALRGYRSPAAVLFALVLFFQFGNEWSIAGWLPIFLVQRLGISPASALWLLALYWLCLMAGRIGAQAILPRFGHGRLLMGSVISAMFGCLVLTTTNNHFGAITGIVLTGGGFAMILPLLAEKIGHRFPYYHPGLFNSIFSIAFSGGLLANASLGYFAERFGIQVVMGLPLVGTIMVFVLVLLIWLAAKLSAPPPGLSPA